MELSQNVMYLVPFLMTIFMGILLKNRWKVKGNEKLEQYWKGYATSAAILSFFVFMFWVLPHLIK